MITDFNEDELYRVQTKLDMLMKCKIIQNLGYEYEQDKYIYLDHSVEDGYEPTDHVEFLNTILAPIIDNGFCDYTNNLDEELLEYLDIIIPTSDYDTDSIVGMTFKFVNKFIDEFIEKNLDENILKEAAENHLNGHNYCCGDSSIDFTQVLLDKKEKALYLIVPDEYVAIDEYVDAMLNFLFDLHSALKNKSENIKEVA